MLKERFKNKKIAIVSDPLTEFGGEQRVLEVLHEMFPQAPVFTGMLDLSNLPKRFKTWDIRVPCPIIATIIKIMRLRSLRLLLIPIYEKLDLQQFDLVISSGTFFAKGVNGKKHIAYIHTTPRFLYGYETESGLRSNAIFRLMLAPVDLVLKLWDFKKANSVDELVCNSKEVQKRIKKFYRCDSLIVNPPVTISGARKKTTTKDYFLIVSRLTKYKNFDIAIKACNMIKAPLVIVGKGGESEYLHSIAGPTVKFMDFVSDSELQKLYQEAKAFIFPGKDEDFGIVPVEAQYFGCPVIAHRSGGLLETVIDGKTGILFDNLTPKTLADILKKFDLVKFKKKDCIDNAAKYSKTSFIKKMWKIVERCCVD